MKRIVSAALCSVAVVLSACRGAGPLPPGEKLGDFADIDKPESYTSATLYTYMDGGADFYVQQGFSRLYVRHYSRSNERFTVELFEMKDAPAASRVYQSSRHPNLEKELTGGCIASVGPSAVEAAKGRYYLVGRNDDPLATRNDALIALSRKILEPLPGPCVPGAKR